MARIRSIKPEFWTDEKVVSLSPLARLLFIGMWNFVDDEGRSEFSPSRLKMQILPADPSEISELLGEIRREKLVIVYTVENKEYFQVVGFSKHQKIDHRSRSKIPPPPNSPEFPRNVPPDQGREGIKERDTDKKELEIEKARPVVASPRDPVLADPDNPLAYYSEGEISVLALEEGPDTEDRICELWRWAYEKGERDSNVIKRMISGRMAKDAKARREAPALREQMENPPALTVSSALASSRLARKNPALDRRVRA